MEKNYNIESDKARSKNFSRVLMPGFKLKRIEDLSDKQLENVAKYDFSDPRQRKNIIRNSALVTSALSGTSALVGVSTRKPFKGAATGALLGGLSGSGLAISGHYHHKSTAKAAKEELERRKGNKK